MKNVVFYIKIDDFEVNDPFFNIMQNKLNSSILLPHSPIYNLFLLFLPNMHFSGNFLKKHPQMRQKFQNFVNKNEIKK